MDASFCVPKFLKGHMEVLFSCLHTTIQIGLIAQQHVSQLYVITSFSQRPICWRTKMRHSVSRLSFEANTDLRQLSV